MAKQKVTKLKELYVRPSLSNLREMFFPLGWDVVEERNEDYPFNTTDVYVVHSRATSVMSTTITQMLTFWLYDYDIRAIDPTTGKKCIRLTNF